MICITGKTPPKCDYFYCFGKWQMPLQLACIKEVCILISQGQCRLLWSVPCLTYLSCVQSNNVAAPQTDMGIEPGISLTWRAKKSSMSPTLGKFAGIAEAHSCSFTPLVDSKRGHVNLQGFGAIMSLQVQSFLSYLSISVCESDGRIPFPSPKIFGMPEGRITEGEVFRAPKLETIVAVGAHILPLHLASC